MKPLSDAKIVDSWGKNAAAWTAAVREGQIESRLAATNAAIVEAVLGRSPRSVLDVGCGEGWLARALAAQGVDVVGIDVVPALIERATAAGGGRFQVASYEDLAAEKLAISVDVAVGNFSLFGEQAVEDVFRVVPALLNAGGAFVVQTLHPVVACGDGPYRDGWRDGSWDGFSSDFIDPAPWYFRTLESWVSLFGRHGLRLAELREPPHPKTQRPASVIFIAEATG